MTSQRRSPRWLRRTVLAAAIAIVGALALLGGSIGFVQATAHDHLYSETDVPTAPVALVLGAQVYSDGTPSPFLAGRLDVAQRLYEAGKVEVILVSGDNMRAEYNEPDAMRQYLIDRGVPAEKVVADYAGFDTYDSCARADRIFGVSKLTVISQDFHLPRAVATCRSLGLEATGVADLEARQYTRAWRYGMVRDQVATVKTVVDLISGRDPVLGNRETSVDQALAGHQLRGK